ncbi:hypothetical protein EJ110_NYTH57585 [Nymphaea thermarum]|nr:hypothetical protein EJ110_NYTH57585 [Nymphaea thermarum]
MSVKGHRKKHVIEEEEPLTTSEKYSTWEEDNNIVMAWNMNSVQAHITPTIAFYTSAKQMWEFMKQTYSHDKNMSKILQVEEELLKLQQVAKAQMLTGAEIPDLAEVYNRLSRLAVTLTPSSTDAPSSTLVVPRGRGQALPSQELEDRASIEGEVVVVQEVDVVDSSARSVEDLDI